MKNTWAKEAQKRINDESYQVFTPPCPTFAALRLRDVAFNFFYMPDDSFKEFVPDPLGALCRIFG